jgi:hypothetical protein
VRLAIACANLGPIALRSLFGILSLSRALNSLSLFSTLITSSLVAALSISKVLKGNDLLESEVSLILERSASIFG